MGHWRKCQHWSRKMRSPKSGIGCELLCNAHYPQNQITRDTLTLTHAYIDRLTLEHTLAHARAHREWWGWDGGCIWTCRLVEVYGQIMFILRLWRKCQVLSCEIHWTLELQWRTDYLPQNCYITAYSLGCTMIWIIYWTRIFCIKRLCKLLSNLC